MRLVLRYLFLLIAFLSLLSGATIGALSDVIDVMGNRIFLLLIPMSLSAVVLIAVNLKFSLPLLLMRNKVISYCLFTLLLSLLFIVSALASEYLLRRALGLPMRISDYGSPWILGDAFSNCILFFLSLLGVSLIKVHEKWQKEMREDERMSANLRNYISEVKERLNPGYIISSLDHIIDLFPSALNMVYSEIDSLCRYLRRQLYELPAPVADSVSEAEVSYPKVTYFLVLKKYRWHRQLIFQLILLAISFGAFYDTPDDPEFTIEKFSGFISLYLVLNAVSYIVILWLYPRFKKRQDIRRYISEVGMLTLGIILPIIMLQILTYDLSPYVREMPFSIMVLSTLGTAMTVALFLGGVSVVLLTENWLAGRRRLSLLRAELLRQEYSFLRKQINPHFLFNVLNNASILSEEEPEESGEMLRELRRLLIYQFDEAGKSKTGLVEEIEFIRSYLALEASRLEPFSYNVEICGDTARVFIPTLIFITFVENAVKHSTDIAGRRHVDVSFFPEDRGLRFVCSNTYRADSAEKSKDGGVGLANTLRRLQFIYGDTIEFSQKIKSDTFITSLLLPNDYLHNS